MKYVCRWICTESDYPGLQYPDSARVQAGGGELVGVSRCSNALVEDGDVIIVSTLCALINDEYVQVMAASMRSTGLH